MRILHDFDLTEYNSYRIESKCKTAVFLDSEEEIIQYFSENSNKKLIILGGGCNVILAQEYYVEDFVIFNGNFSAINLLENHIVETEAGTSLLSLSGFAMKNCIIRLKPTHRNRKKTAENCTE